MMIIVPTVYILCLGVYTIIQCRRLWIGHDKREALICVLSMTLSAIVGMLLIAEVELPTLVLPYKIVFEPIGKLILSP
ncbi:hypothetical protein [Paenibacillus harenae]|uniref:Uncharacterized protein n=1 Tax=Paenibacillus harenae TaxID=306543 RepID=A0ABT9U5E8_PAEHA|nr:hypothetical protein [Paenibacillus harenae]MDQ0113905.1 hypothetical protein [Paenibacillus harenae]